MSKELVKTDFALGSGDVVKQVERIQQVMRDVMKEGVHYGKIPGAGDKPTLFKPGAEKLMLTFRISNQLFIEDLSTPDERRYRVRSVATHVPTGAVLGEGVGEGSSNEEKYKWRAAIGGEFADTPADRRREKWVKGYNGSQPKKIQQVRTNPEDIANTVLKMAKKRALVDMTLTVTAASDIFDQDIEDLPEEFLEGGEPVPTPEPKKKSAVDTGETSPASTANCSICQKSINPSIEKFSREKFGKPLCFDCQKAEKAKNATPGV